MPEPTTPLPVEKFAPAADERTTVMSFLDHYRVVLARKIEGITEEEARRAACPPSDLSLLGLVRHMADVERNWARRSFLGEAYRPIFHAEAHPEGDIDGDFHPPADATIAEALDAYWAEIADADAIYAAAALEDLEARERDPQHSLRWILVHLVEEYARHCGHADLLRQAIDGVVDD